MLRRDIDQNTANESIQQAPERHSRRAAVVTTSTADTRLDPTAEVGAASAASQSGGGVRIARIAGTLGDDESAEVEEADPDEQLSTKWADVITHHDDAVAALREQCKHSLLKQKKTEVAILTLQQGPAVGTLGHSTMSATSGFRAFLQSRAFREAWHRFLTR